MSGGGEEGSSSPFFLSTPRILAYILIMTEFKELIGGSSVTAYITGATREVVEQAAARYLRDWPEEGYCTSVSPVREDIEGGYSVIIWRLASCD
jgi:hypothetical protein